MPRYVADHHRRCNRCNLIRSGAEGYCPNCRNGEFALTALPVGTVADDRALWNEQRAAATQHSALNTEPTEKTETQRR
jgi:hypothetical protein